MMHDLRMVAGQQPERPLRANHIDRLPEAVQHEHWLFEYGFHRVIRGHGITRPGMGVSRAGTVARRHGKS